MSRRQLRKANRKGQCCGAKANSCNTCSTCSAPVSTCGCSAPAADCGCSGAAPAPAEAEEAAPEAPEAEEAPIVQEDGQELDPKAAHSPVTKGHFSKEDLGKYIENFGKDMGVEFFMNDINFADAQSQYISAQSEKIAELKAQIELNEQTEDQPLSGNNGEAVESKGQGFKVVIK